MGVNAWKIQDFLSITKIIHSAQITILRELHPYDLIGF